MNEKDLIDLLEKIPTLIEAAEIYKETSNQMISTLVNAIKQQPRAVIPESELTNLEKVIKSTHCAPPDIKQVSREIAKRIAENVSNAVDYSIRDTIANSLKNAAIPVEHTHVIEKNLKDVADKKMVKTIIILLFVIQFLLMAIGFSALSYFDGKTYWGKQYYEVYTSKYLTPEEKAKMDKNSYTISMLPSNYAEDYEVAQLNIKKMKKELKKREKNDKKSK